MGVLVLRSLVMGLLDMRQHNLSTLGRSDRQSQFSAKGKQGNVLPSLFSMCFTWLGNWSTFLWGDPCFHCRQYPVIVGRVDHYSNAIHAKQHIGALLWSWGATALIYRVKGACVCVKGIHSLTIWSASSRTVLRLNLREQKLKRSSKLGPSSSITITL